MLSCKFRPRSGAAATKLGFGHALRLAPDRLPFDGVSQAPWVFFSRLLVIIGDRLLGLAGVDVPADGAQWKAGPSSAGLP